MQISREERTERVMHTERTEGYGVLHIALLHYHSSRKMVQDREEVGWGYHSIISDGQPKGEECTADRTGNDRQTNMRNSAKNACTDESKTQA